MARKSRKNLPTNVEIKPCTLLKTVMYLRLSVEDNEINTSIDNQREIIKNYVSNKPDFKLVNEYIDNGKTGTNFNRTGFLNMIEDVEKGKIDCIIVKDLSRFGRNMIDTGHYIEKFLPMHNVRFIAVNDDFDTDNKNVNSFILPLKNIINETYAKEISFKVRKEVKLSMERGQWISSIAPFGYTRVRINKENRIVVNEETACIVKKIYNLALKGLSINEIREQLNIDNVPTPTAFKKSQGVLKSDTQLSSQWNRVILKRILTNEVYIGTLVQGRRSILNGKDVKLPKEQWYIVKNNHTPIITDKAFYEVQKIINGSINNNVNIGAI